MFKCMFVDLISPYFFNMNGALQIVRDSLTFAEPLGVPALSGVRCRVKVHVCVLPLHLDRSLTPHLAPLNTHTPSTCRASELLYVPRFLPPFRAPHASVKSGWGYRISPLFYCLESSTLTLYWHTHARIISVCRTSPRPQPAYC